MRAGMCVLGLMFLGSLAGANPRVEQDVRPLMATPRQWFESPTPALHTALLRVFAQRGIDLYPETLQLIERNFDRFFPVMVEAQSPPWTVQPGLQRWYRAHANREQADAMKAALREWLDVDSDPWNRTLAVEALGDWRDSRALTRLRALPSSPVITATIRRIEDPGHADPFVVGRDGRLKLQRPVDELDSIVVVAYEPVGMELRTWRPDPKSERLLLAALGSGTRVRKVNEKGISTLNGTIYIGYRDRREITLAANGDGWRLHDNGRLGPDIDIVSSSLDDAIDAELTRVGVLPKGPRFVEESVTMWIHRDEMRVLGVYSFEGRPERGTLTLVYPFPVDSTLGTPRLDTVFLDTNSASGSAAHVELQSESIPWHIEIQPGEANQYRLTVGYRQELHGRSATYVLRSALDWKRPLRKATLTVVMDESLGQLQSKYVFTKSAGGRYLFEASPFSPQRDLVVRW